jgi:hypothetical protein
MEPGAFARWSVPENVLVVDLRRQAMVAPRGFWDMRSLSGISLFAKSQTAAADDKRVKMPLSVTFDVECGGTNAARFKDTFYTIRADQTFRGRGESHLVGGVSRKYGSGDFTGPTYFLFGYGNCLTEGDECGVGGRIDLRQGAEVMTGTVESASVADDGKVALRYVDAENAFSRGEQRLVIKTSGPVDGPFTRGLAQVTSPSAPGVTVSGQGLDGGGWGSLCPEGRAPCEVTDLCLSLDADTNAGLKLVLPVKAIDTAATLKLDTTVQGGEKPWWGSREPSTYAIYRCSWSEDVGDAEASDRPRSGTLVLAADGYRGWQPGDAFEMPLGYAHYSTGLTILHERLLPAPAGVASASIAVRSDARPNTLYNTDVMRVTGSYHNGINLLARVRDSAIRVRDATRAMTIEPPSSGQPAQIRWEFDESEGRDAFVMQVSPRVTGPERGWWRIGDEGHFWVRENGYAAVRANAPNTALFVNVESPGDTGLRINAPADFKGDAILVTTGGAGRDQAVFGVRAGPGGTGRAVYLGGGTALSFEGRQDDGGGTTLTSAGASAPRSIVLPDASGKLVTAAGAATSGVMLWAEDGGGTDGESVCGGADLGCRAVRLPDGTPSTCEALHTELFYALCS